MDCLFCKIVQGTIPAQMLFENDELISFQDINPQAPTHILIIPKKHIASINEANESDKALLGSMLLAAQKLAKQKGIHDKGYRLVINTNSDGGQTVDHLHLHMLGGRQMNWPPG